ncbi:putative NAD(P)-binding domain-containing protein [Seiridium cardinale]
MPRRTKFCATSDGMIHEISSSKSSQSVELSTKPIVQSIEDATTSKFVYRLTNVQPKVVVWAAGAGGPGGDERTVTVDHGGAIKMMDACAEAEVERFLP